MVNMLDNCARARVYVPIGLCVCEMLGCISERFNNIITSTQTECKQNELL